MKDLVLTSTVALCAIWVLYPLAISALAALRRPARRSAPGATPVPTATVVIATRDDAATIRARVQNVLESQYPAARLQVVVALDAMGSRTSAADLAGMDPRVTVVEGDASGGKAAALNAGVRAARGDVLVFTDAHQRFRPDAIGLLVAALADGRTGAASGCLEVAAHGGSPTLGDRYWFYERWLRRCEAEVHSTVGVTGAIYAVKAPLWVPLPRGLILDDVYAPMQLVLRGYRVAFVEAAKAEDARRFEAKQEYRRKTRTLTGVLQLCAWLPAVLVPVRNPIWLQFVFHKLLRLLTPYLALAIAVGTAVLLAEAVGTAIGDEHRIAAAALVACGIALILARPRLRRRAGELVSWSVALQAAVVVATYNGLRGRWDVWHR